MSEVMLHGVLNMPTELWDDSEIDKAQRHSRYVEASEKIIDLEQQNEALMAQVEELKGVIEVALNHKWNIPTGVLYPVNVVQAREVIANTPKQSLDSLKSKVEEEAIAECKEHLNPIASGLIWRTELSRMLNDMPRKYAKV